MNWNNVCRRPGRWCWKRWNLQWKLDIDILTLPPFITLKIHSAQRLTTSSTVNWFHEMIFSLRQRSVCRVLLTKTDQCYKSVTYQWTVQVVQCTRAHHKLGPHLLGEIILAQIIGLWIVCPLQNRGRNKLMQHNRFKAWILFAKSLWTSILSVWHCSLQMSIFVSCENDAWSG